MKSASTRARIVRTLAALSLTGAAVVGAVGAAEATDPYIPAGGPGSFTVNSPGVSFLVLPSMVDAQCTTFTQPMTVSSPGTARAHSVKAGDITGLTASGCTVQGYGATVAKSGTANWPVFVTGDATSGAWPIRIDGIAVAVNVPDISCSGTVSGSLAGTFNPSTQRFTAGSASLTVSGASAGCANIDVANGDTVTVTGSWTNTGTAITLTH